MTRKLVFAIVGCFIGSIGIVAGLLALSRDIRDTPGSFLRQYPPHPVLEADMIKLPDEHYYFAGATASTIYLANTLKPLEILEITSDMSDTSVSRLDIGITDRLKYYRITVQVDSPYFYFMDGAIPYLYRGNIADWKGSPFMTDTTYFIDAVPISHTSFAICALSAMTDEKVLGRLVINSGEVALNYELLEKQIDGVFDVDGALTYSKELNKLVYLYYYRNQFIVMDTNLNLEYRGNTIDTFRTARVKTAEIYSENAIGLAAPPIVTNKSCDVSGRWLFVHSLLPAKNEYMTTFNKASIIDVYDVETREYRFSLHVFDEMGDKMKSFKVVHQSLFALYDGAIRRYELTDKYFEPYRQDKAEQEIPGQE